ncbi:hypothetical protein MJO28_011735 [Puccinia striiformis f. sp. tritici]|uniref:Uncharacterized protein n=2 Tax=Puccinia striiformis f. sp. tritici TaxID=168172 RepID=A0A0L0W142_9BASI|nr:hypothetical protein MJO28_011735 [Puccinia striiformis f. sp. tritici]KAI7946973.1 hypothetical protein MJO29_011500 [Puccinia striiformis f. sp. tritici]KNF04955.1 hypothetical protein PSTG_02008 [Puccinia striiformis f. sp. tritici PST-78]
MEQAIIHSMRWLGHPKENGKAHGSIVMNLFNENTTKKIIKGGLFFDGRYFSSVTYKKSPTQCFQCLEVGQTVRYCKNTPMCKLCGDTHNSRDCIADIPHHNCVKCIQREKKNNPDSEIDKTNVRFAHCSTSNKCPLKSKNFRPQVTSQ